MVKLNFILNFWLKHKQKLHFLHIFQRILLYTPLRPDTVFQITALRSPGTQGCVLGSTSSAELITPSLSSEFCLQELRTKAMRASWTLEFESKKGKVCISPGKRKVLRKEEALKWVMKYKNNLCSTPWGNPSQCAFCSSFSNITGC